MEGLRSRVFDCHMMKPTVCYVWVTAPRELERGVVPHNNSVFYINCILKTIK